MQSVPWENNSKVTQFLFLTFYVTVLDASSLVRYVLSQW